MDIQTRLLEAFRFRHACKQFDARRPIAERDFDVILEAARLSPSSFGLEPWRFVVIENMALRTRLLDTVWGGQGQLPTASHLVAIFHRKDEMRHDADYIEHMMADIQKMPDEARQAKRGRYRKFQETDYRLLESPRALHDWAIRQTYIPLANMMTAAALMGIDSCPIEGFDRAATEATLADAGVLDRQCYGLAVMVAFGYRINPQPPKTRQPREDVVAWVR